MYSTWRQMNLDGALQHNASSRDPVLGETSYIHFEWVPTKIVVTSTLIVFCGANNIFLDITPEDNSHRHPSNKQKVNMTFA